MNPACALGERRFAVRAAARAWQRAGLIDAPTQAAISTAYADDRERVGTAVRVLLFVFAWIAVQSAAGFVSLFTLGHAIGVLALIFGVLSALATEWLRNRLRRARSGAEEATALMALSGIAGGVGWILMETLPDSTAIPLVFATASVLSCLAAWRWGGTLYGIFAAGGLFVFLLRFGWARWTWLGAAALAAAPLVRLAESERLAPSQRRAAWAALVVAMVAAYSAVHLGLWDEHVFENLSGWMEGARTSTTPRVVAVAGTALLPFALLFAGLSARRRLLVDLGLVAGLVSATTAIAYWRLEPAWLVLVLGGAALIGLALLVRAWLDRAPRKERAGWTAEPLFEHPDRQSLVELAASLATLSPAARQPAAAPGFQGGGGEMGGGGASGSF